MKKVLIVISLLLSSVQLSYAGISDVLNKVPALKNGIAYSIKEKGVNYLSTIDIASYKNVSLELGVAGDNDESDWKAVSVLSYPIVKLKDYGITLPVLDLLECNLGVYAGLGHINGKDLSGSKFDYGVSATIIKLKF